MRIELVIRGKLKGVSRDLTKQLRQEFFRWGGRLTKTLNRSRPKRVQLAPLYSPFSGRPQGFIFIFRFAGFNAFRIEVYPPSRAKAIYAMEYGSTKEIYARTYGIRALQIVKPGGKPNEAIGDKVRLRASRAPSRAHPWVGTVVYRSFRRLRSDLRKALEITILEASMEERLVR